MQKIDTVLFDFGGVLVPDAMETILFTPREGLVDQLGLDKEKYAVVTIHRAENTDNINVLKDLIDSLNELSKDIALVFPIHPRTNKILEANKININSRIKVTEPLGYLDFIKLMDNSLFIMTDSGGIQEEAAALDIPCLVLRNETEWIYLTSIGKNLLLGVNKKDIVSRTKLLLKNMEQIKRMKEIKFPVKGNVANNVVEIFKNLKNANQK